MNITIADATAYCDWLTAQDNSHSYRLPTDEEWILGAGHMPKDVVMNAGRVKTGLTSVDAYNQTTGACGGIDFGVIAGNGPHQSMRAVRISSKGVVGIQNEMIAVVKNRMS